MLGLVYSTLK